MNDLDLSLFSDADLDALEKGDLSALSEEGLSILETRQSIISKGPKTRYRPRSLPPGEVTEAKPAQTRLPTLPREPKIRTDVSPGGGTSALLGMLGGFPRMAAGVTSIFGENELSRQLKELEAGLRERAPVKETYDVTKYAAEVIPAATTAKVLSKVPMASRTAQQLLQAAGQAGTAAAVEPEDRAEAATVAGGVGLIPVGTKTLGVVTEKVNEVLTGGKPDVVRDQLARIAEQLGFKIQAGQVSRTAPVSTPGAGEAAVTNQDLANRWASAPTGETTDKITGTFISDRKAALGADYDSIFQNRQFAITGPDIRAFENVLDLEDSISPAHVPKVKEMAKSILKNYDEMSAKIARSGTKMPAEEGVDAFPFTIAGEGLQRLRNKLRLAASSATDRSAAFEINKLVDQIDEIVKGTDPKLYEKLIDTNRKYRATSTLETLEKKGDIPAGDVSLERLGREVSDDKFNPLFPIGKIGQELGIRGVWEPEVSGLMRGAAGEARQLIRPGMTRIILNRIAMYPRSQAARNLQRKIMDAEATGGLGNLSLSAEELAILNPIMQSIAEEPPEEKAKGGVVYSEKERQLLDRYANGGSVTRPTLPADRSAGYKQPGEGEEDRLIRFFEAAARELPDAIKQNVTSNADLASKYLKFKFGMMSPEEAMRVAKMLPNSLKALAANAVQTVKEAPRAIAEATPESAGKFAGQFLGAELADPTRIGRAVGAVTKPVMSQVVKPKGGEFLQKGPYSLEGTVKALKFRSPFTNEDPQVLLANFEKLSAEKPAKTDFEKTVADDTIKTLKGNVALNDWVENKLAKYVRNEMATPEDPIRKLAEEGILHVNPEQLNFRLDYYGKTIPLPDQQFLAKSDAAKTWEGASDMLMGSETAGELVKKYADELNFAQKSIEDPASYRSFIEENPWIFDVAKKDPERKIYYSQHRNISPDLGFDHLRDELRNSVRPDTDLPQQLRLTPEQLGRMSVPDAVRHVSKINRWREKKKAEANFALANNAATVPYKDYPDQKYGWFQLKAKSADDVSAREADEIGEDVVVRESQKALQDALQYEGDLMGHCVGGYCDDVISGKSQIYSLRDKKTGAPHVTIEVEPVPTFKQAKSQIDASYPDLDENEKIRMLRQAGWIDEEGNIYPDPPAKIIQIKGKGNRKPKDEYIPFVQDFVRSNNFEVFDDLDNANLIKVHPSSDVANFLKSSNKPIPKYVTNEELSEILKELGKKDTVHNRNKATIG
jgi:hypothetical protein